MVLGMQWLHMVGKMMVDWTTFDHSNREGGGNYNAKGRPEFNKSQGGVEENDEVLGRQQPRYFWLNLKH